MAQSIIEEIGHILPPSGNLAETLARAADYATQQAHPEVTLEHLLLALTEDPDAARVLAASAVQVEQLKGDVSSHLGRLEDHSAAGGTAGISADLRQILEAAAAAARGRRDTVDGAIVLAAIVGDGRSTAAHMLGAHGLTFEDAIRALQAAAPHEEAEVEQQQANPTPQPDYEPVSAAGYETEPPPVELQPHPSPYPPGATADEILASARQRVEGRIAPSGAEADQASTHDAAGTANAGKADPVELEHGPSPAHAAKRPLPPGAIRPAPKPEPASAPVVPPPQAETGIAVAKKVDEAVIDEVLASIRKTGNMRLPSAGTSRPTPGSPGRSGVLPPIPTPVRPASAPAGPHANPPGRPPSPSGRTDVQARTFDRDFFGPRGPGNDQGPGRGNAAAPSPPPGRHAGPAGAPPPGPRRPKQQHQRAEQAPMPPAARAPAPGAPPSPARHGSASPMAPDTAATARQRTSDISLGQMVENIPRTMRVGIPVVVEARVARAEVKALADGLQGGGAVWRHELTVTKAMSVRLRAPDGGFFIETASPETQWIENALGLITDDYVSWRWAVTPKERGAKRLQLVISARTVGTDGLAAETALPDQIVNVKVRVNYAKTVKRIGGWALAAIVGGVLARFGEDLPATIASLMNTIVK